MTEAELREHIWKNRERWAELIEPLSPEQTTATTLDVGTLSPEALLLELARERLVATDHAVRELHLLGREVKMERDGESRIRIDLFGMLVAAPGLAVIELKVSGGTSRESFTELLAYGQALTATFPGLCKDDLLLVLVAPMARAPRIVREAFLAALLFDRRRVYALEPIVDPSGPEPVRLRPWVPAAADIARFARVAFHPDNLALEKVVWETLEKDEWPREAMDHVAARAALAMEAAGIHGFAYTSRSFPELKWMFPNGLVCVGLNPFEVAHRKMLNEEGVPPAKAWSVQGSGTRLEDLLPGLGDLSEVAPIPELLQDAASTWDTHVAQIAHDTVNAVIRRYSGREPHTDRGGFSWEQFAGGDEDNYGDNFSVFPTGIMRDLFDLVVSLDYAFAREHGIDEHPVHGDMWGDAERSLRSHVFFREFLLRMQHEGGSMGAWTYDDDADVDAGEAEKSFDALFTDDSDDPSDEGRGGPAR